jgi:hypothetical protein
MKTSPRRLTFQLISLFDLLMIVIFAQYMDVLNTTQSEESKRAGERETAQEERLLSELRREHDADELSRSRAALFALQQEREGADKDRVEAAEAARQARENMLRLAKLVTKLFDLPEKLLKEALAARSEADQAKLRKAVEDLAAKNPGDIVKHILTLDEIQKRCDLWEVHLGDDNVATFTAGSQSQRFRATSADKFEAELFRLYKTLPQPKSLVIVLLSWSDADLSYRDAAVSGLTKGAERMEADSNRQSRFHAAVLGFIPGKLTEDR